MRELIAPACIGEELGDTPGLLRKLERRFHNFGRNGAVTFALSGIDIALWDIAAKAVGKPLHALLGGAKRDRVPAYASLLRYGDPALVAATRRRPSPAAIAGSSCTRWTWPASAPRAMRRRRRCR